jgi:transposase
LKAEVHRSSPKFTEVRRSSPVFTGFRRIDRWPYLSHDDLVSDTVAVESITPSRRRLRRTPEEKRRIVEATFVPGASIPRVAREHGVNADQAFQWRYEYRKGTLGVREQARTMLVPVTVTAEPNSVALPGIAPVTAPSGSIHIELSGRAVISVEAGVDPELVRTVLGSLLR